MMQHINATSENAPMTVPADARSTVADFEAYLKSKRILSPYDFAYAKDMHFNYYGFDFIQSVADVDNFLQELESAPRSAMSGQCSKLWVIKNYLERYPSNSPEHYVEQFKTIAATARRTNCGCHDTGSYALTKRIIYAM
jgi:hypothetical protein